jgi:hypothetical protein
MVSASGCQKPQRCIVSDTLLGNENGGIGFGSCVIVGAAEFYTLNPFCHRSSGWRMFSANHFAFPFSIGTFVGPDVKDIGVAALHLPIIQYQDATNLNANSID